MQGRPSPRAITAAWLVMPPRSVSTALAACMPRMSSGWFRGAPGCKARRAPPWPAPRRRKDDPAARRTGAGRNASISRSRGAFGIDLRVQSSFSARGSTRRIASSRGITPSSQAKQQCGCGPRRALNPERVEHIELAVIQREFDLHLFAQLFAAVSPCFSAPRKDRGIVLPATARDRHGSGKAPRAHRTTPRGPDFATR